MDASTVTFIKDYLWAPLIALIGWAFHYHHKRVDDLRTSTEEDAEKLRAYVDQQFGDRIQAHVAHAGSRAQAVPLYEAGKDSGAVLRVSA